MGDVSRPAFIVGLPGEARLIARALGAPLPQIICSGTDPTRIRAAVEQLRHEHVSCLLSCGFAGGLDPAAAAGDIVIADAIVAGRDRRLAVDESIAARLARALTEAGVAYRRGAIAGVDRILASPADKRLIGAGSGALAADMESHVMAEAAGPTPIAVMRVVLDPADRAIPRSVLAALDRNGETRPLTLIAGLARRPREIGALAALAFDYGKARRALVAALRALARAFPPD
jgi:hypothetical protein